MNLKGLIEIKIILTFLVVLAGAFYGIDKWVDSKIASHPVVIVDGKYIDDNEQQILKLSEAILRLQDDIDRLQLNIVKLNIKIEKLLAEEYYP